MSGPPISAARRTWTVVALLTATFLASLDATAVGPAMPTIVGDLGGLTLYGWVFAAYLLTNTVSTPLYGKLADLIGRKTTFLLGVGFFVAGSVACGFASSMPLLIAARALQGLGAGAILPVTQTVMGDLFDVEARARVQGIFSLVWGASSVAGPAIGGLLVDHVSWRWLFWINVPVGALSAALLAFVLRERRPHRTLPPLDLAGASTLLVALTSVLVAMMVLEAGAFGWAAALLVFGALATIVFVRIERRAKEPVLPLDLFADRAIAVPAASGFFVGAVLFAQLAYLPLLLVGVYGQRATQAGSMLIPMSLAWTVATFVGGRMMMRLGFRPTIRAGLVLIAIGSAATVFARAWPWWVILPIAATIGAGMGLVISTFTIAAQDRVPFERRGAVTALMLFSRSIGGTVATGFLGLVLSRMVADGLATQPEARGLAPSDIVSGAMARLSSAALVAAREALGVALDWVFGAVAVAAVIALAIGWLYPHVARSTRESLLVEPSD